MDTIKNLIDAWPLVLGCLSLAAAVGVLTYRSDSHERALEKLRRCLFADDGKLVYCTAGCADEIKVEVHRRVTLLEQRLEKDEDIYLKLKEHDQRCENAALRTAAMVKELLNDQEKRLLQQIALNHRETLELLRAMNRQ